VNRLAIDVGRTALVLLDLLTEAVRR